MEASERRLRRFEVVDRQGFGRPVVALTGVMPATWHLVASDVTYDTSRECPVMSVTTSFQVAAEDRRHGLELFPASYSVWFDEPSAEVMYGSSALAGGGCERGPVMDAPVYVRHRLLPRFRSGGVVTAVETVPPLTQALERRVRRVSSRNTALRVLRTDVSLVKVLYPAHRTEERVLVFSVHQGQTFDPRAFSGPPQQWASYRPLVLGMWAPEGEWERHRATYEEVIGSLMQETDWLERQTQLDVAMGRTTTRAARDRRLIWDATVELSNPTLLGALRNRETGDDVFPVSLWTGGGVRYAFGSGVRKAWTVPSGEIVVTGDATSDGPGPGGRPLRPGADVLPGEESEASDHDGDTRLAAPRGGTLSAPSGSSDTSGIAPGGSGSPADRRVPARPARAVLAQPGGIATPD